MIQELTKNVDSEVSMLREIASYSQRLALATPTEEKMLREALLALQAQMKLLNASVPALVAGISISQRLPGKQQERRTSLERFSFSKPSGESMSVTVHAKDKEKFLHELQISEKALAAIKKQHYGKIKEMEDSFQHSRGYVKLSNRFFFSPAQRLLQAGHFAKLRTDLRKANLSILPESYISLMFFTSFIGLIAGTILALGVFFLIQGSILLKIAWSIWIPPFFALASYLILYAYPSTEIGSLAKRIDRELPFAVIHMNAISGAGLEPTNIFKIIVLSTEYPFLRKEIRKLLNQINLYGYDLVTALNNAAQNSSSPKLAELFLGLSTTITSGGSLQSFFEKRAETLLVSYRLEREQFTKIAETFMDIYITVVIAAPMILLLLFILLSIGDFNVGITPASMTAAIIALIAIINLIFLTILHIKQPSY